MNEAQGIVCSCPQCSHHGPGLGIRVNPRGLKALELWQMDVIHVLEFGRLKYVSVDTFSKFVWATAQPGERAIHVCRHLIACFAVMGVPEAIKPDNGPAYSSNSFRQFMTTWGVEHETGLPNSPTGQVIVERTKRTLKDYLHKYMSYTGPKECLHKALFVMNHLCVLGDSNEPPAIVHNACANTDLPKLDMSVYYRNPKTGIWEGPAPVMFNGHGYMCVSTPTGPLWVPSKWTA